jgi:hypothetical protein
MLVLRRATIILRREDTLMLGDLGKRWTTWRPEKGTLVWSFLLGAGATAVLGFGFAGWKTGGSAQAMADAAAATSRAELVAAACVDRFSAAADAGVQLAALKAENAWGRSGFIEKGGWVSLPSGAAPAPKAAALCAERLVSASAS